MNDRRFDEFIKRNPDIHEIFHEGYRRGVIEGFTIAAKKASAFLKIIAEIQEEKMRVE
ncbi:hypothetical protein [Limosilactobacillus fastidiosus]|uniref:Uncharacterized protein n=1 Tax=Limosilactobacillus fastidiosus TaxID=2759855 RepID=A0ABR6E951_9LACO|nr:hypothetical protein [Limosilactobacillus fastidiosus]MBB1063612.1 hypothetical protein [Limosilactobacillus fastidiosus]MCD7084188.1 hypothetical protein [Limosilactobacillus fastidiosus]